MWFLLGFIGVVIGISALIKGKMPSLKIYSRKVAAIVLVVSFIVMIAGAGSPDEAPEEAIVGQQNTIEEDINEVSPDAENSELEAEQDRGEKASNDPAPPPTASSGSATSTQSTTTLSGTLKAHFIDVGQGDAILIQTPEQNILIDGGDRGNTVVNYLKAQALLRWT